MSDSDSCAPGSSTDCHFTCPSGGTWFVCETAPYFVGCCSSDPCTNTATPACPDLYPASFDGGLYDDILPNNCIDSPSSNWYSCNFTSPRFLGCCASNPCATENGCPESDLLPAAWSRSVDGQLALFQDKSPDDEDNDDSRSSGLSRGAIAGIAIAAAAAVIIIIVAAFWFLRRRRRQQRQSTTLAEGQRMFSGEYGAHEAPTSPYQDSHVSSPDPTIKYASGSSAGFTYPSLSPPLGSENGHRPVSEIGSSSDDYHHRPNHGLHISGGTVPPPIPELHSEEARQPVRQPEVHELDGMPR